VVQLAQGLALAGEAFQDAGVAVDDPGVEGLDGDELSGVGVGPATSSPVWVSVAR